MWISLCLFYSGVIFCQVPHKLTVCSFYFSKQIGLIFDIVITFVCFFILMFCLTYKFFLSLGILCAEKERQPADILAYLSSFNNAGFVVDWYQMGPRWLL